MMITRHAIAVAVSSVMLSAEARGQAAKVPTTYPLPAVSSIKTATDAAALVRRLYFVGQHNDGTALGDSLTRRFPRDSRLRFWYIANVANLGLSVLADSLTKRIDTLSRDPWLLAARAFSRHNPVEPARSANAQAVRLAKRARALAPRDPDFVWLTATMMMNIPGFPAANYPETFAYIDSAARRVGNPIELRVLHADALFGLANPFNPGAMSTPPDTAKQNAAFREYTAARGADSMSYNARLNAVLRLYRTNEAEAIALAREAIAIAPRAPNARQVYWMLLSGERGKTPAERQAAVAADRAAFLTATDSAPWALATVLATTRSTAGREPIATFLEDRILAKAPRTRWAEDVLLGRASQWRDSLFAARDSARPGPKSDSVVVRKRYLDAMEAFMNKGWVADPRTVEQANSSLFFEIREDSTYPADKLLAVVKRLVASTTFGAPSFRYGEGARALANRKIDLPFAESIAREGLKHTNKYLNEMPGYFFASIGEKADALDGANASLRQQLGWVYFSGGKLAQADSEMTRALDLSKKNMNLYYDFGRLRTAQGREDEAELLYAQGMSIRTRGVNPNRKELERLYQKKNGSIEGWEKYISALEEKERTTRRDKILATRDTAAKVVPGFKLPDLNGKVVDSDSARGQYLVVNFWGMWCGPCVAEMPELQQFYDKYRNDTSVSIFTISNDKDLAELREWMAKRKLTIPTLFDDGFVAKTAQIHVFPTTWFIDRDGKVQFTAVGNTGALVEEWSWRLDATKAGPKIQP
jgi:thiol-disulfide isomerase/thioredoxin